MTPGPPDPLLILERTSIAFRLAASSAWSNRNTAQENRKQNAHGPSTIKIYLVYYIAKQHAFNHHTSYWFMNHYSLVQH